MAASALSARARLQDREPGGDDARVGPSGRKSGACIANPFHEVNHPRLSSSHLWLWKLPSVDRVTCPTFAERPRSQATGEALSR